MVLMQTIGANRAQIHYCGRRTRKALDGETDRSFRTQQSGMARGGQSESGKAGGAGASRSRIRASAHPKKFFQKCPCIGGGVPV